MNTTPHLDANRDLIKTIITQYADGNGSVAWKRAFTENPKWKATLIRGPKDMARLHNWAWAERRFGRDQTRVGIPGQNTDRSYPKNDLDAPRYRLFAQNLERLQDLARQYTARSGKVYWTKALRDHPELRQELGLDSLYKQRLLNFYLRLVKKQGCRPAAHANAMSALPVQVITPRPATNGAGAAMPRIEFCPGCGTDFTMLAAAVPRGQTLRLCPCCGFSIAQLQKALEAVMIYGTH